MHFQPKPSTQFFAKVQKHYFWVISGLNSQIWAEREFFRKIELSFFFPYGPLNSCKKSEKSFEPIPRTCVAGGRTDGRTDGRTSFYWTVPLNERRINIGLFRIFHMIILVFRIRRHWSSTLEIHHVFPHFFNIFALRVFAYPFLSSKKWIRWPENVCWVPRCHYDVIMEQIWENLGKCYWSSNNYRMVEILHANFGS